MRAAVALSEHPDTRTAALEVMDTIERSLSESGSGEAPAFVQVTASFHHRAALTEACAEIRAHLAPQALIGATAHTVIAGPRAPERRFGLVALAVAGPGIHARAFGVDWLRGPAEVLSPIAWRRLGGLEPMPPDPASPGEEDGDRPDPPLPPLPGAHAGTWLLADPFTTDPDRLLPTLAEAFPGPLAGAMASGGSHAGANVLIADDLSIVSGVVGATFSGAIALDPMLSQGCRPIGPALVVTGSDERRILSLGGRPAFEVASEILRSVGESTRGLLGGGLHLGIAFDEHRERFGRDDFLIRDLAGVDRRHGALVMRRAPRPGRTVRFHVRDAETAEQDLRLVLDLQQLREPPVAVLLASAGDRGAGFSGVEGHDAAIAWERLGEPPLAGLLSAGEIAPIRQRVALHAHTCAGMLIRRPDASP